MLLDSLSQRLIRLRLPLLLLVLLIAAGLGYSAATKLRFDFTPQDLFTTYEGALADAEAFADTFGDTENISIVLLQGERDGRALEADAIGYLCTLSRLAEQEPWVDRVDGLCSTPLPWRREGEDGAEFAIRPLVEADPPTPEELAAVAAVAQRPTVEGVFINETGSITLLALSHGPGWYRMEALEETTARLHQLLADHPPPAGLTTEVAGLPPIRVSVGGLVAEEMVRLGPLSLAICSAILFAAFRWWPGLVLPGVAVVLSAVGILGAMALVGVPIDIINQTVPVLIVVIGISDAIHLVDRYREELHGLGPAGDRVEAARHTLKAMITACFLTSFTTAVGFASLQVSQTAILRRFGLTAAAGVMLAYLVTILVVPGLLAQVAPPKKRPPGRLEEGLVWLTRRILAHPRKVVAGFVLIIGGALALTVSDLIIDTRLLGVFDQREPLYQSTRLLEEEFSGILPLELMLSSDEPERFDEPAVVAAMESLGGWLEDQEGVLRVRGYPVLLRDTWQSWVGQAHPGALSSRQIQTASMLLGSAEDDPTAPFVTLDRQRARLNAQLRDLGTTRIQALSRDIEARFAADFADFPDIQLALVGDAAIAATGLDSLIRDLLASLGTAFVIIFGMMVLLFRSPRMGAISVPPNVFPLVLTMAWMAARGITLNTSTMIIFSISMGLAVDDTIHLMARFREERASGLDRDAAIIAAVRGAGRAVVVTSLMLMFGLTVMLDSRFIPVRRFGELIAITAALCLVADLVLLPALLRLGLPADAPSGKLTTKP